MKDLHERSDGGPVRWVCHTCQMIGSEAEARAHKIAKGHEVERLPDDLAEAVLDEQANAQAFRVAALLDSVKP